MFNKFTAKKNKSPESLTKYIINIINFGLNVYLFTTIEFAPLVHWFAPLSPSPKG